jgi:hypothetical protein
MKNFKKLKIKSIEQCLLPNKKGFTSSRSKSNKNLKEKTKYDKI